MIKCNQYNYAIIIEMYNKSGVTLNNHNLIYIYISLLLFSLKVPPPKKNPTVPALSLKPSPSSLITTLIKLKFHYIFIQHTTFEKSMLYKYYGIVLYYFAW